MDGVSFSLSELYGTLYKAIDRHNRTHPDCQVSCVDFYLYSDSYPRSLMFREYDFSAYAAALDEDESFLVDDNTERMDNAVESYQSVKKSRPVKYRWW